MNLLEFVDRQPKFLVVSIGIFLVLVVGFMDYVTGLEISFAVFYLIPVSMMAWFVGSLSGILISIACAAVWFLADLFASASYSHPVIPYWNAMVILGFFLIVSLSLSSLRRAIGFEQTFAREIQQGFFPKKMPEVRDFEFSGTSQPSDTIGGDYFDVLQMSEARAAVCIADVVGHGVPAALLMSNLQAAVKILSQDSHSPAQLCKQLNRMFCTNTTPGTFITFCYALLDSESKKLIYVNAGHNPPILVRGDGSIVRLQGDGLAIGLQKDYVYHQTKIDLASNDRLLLFTDGVVEMSNSKDEQFGETRLIGLMKKYHDLSAADLRKKLLAATIGFGGGVLQDDVTVLVIAVKESEARAVAAA